MWEKKKTGSEPMPGSVARELEDAVREIVGWERLSDYQDTWATNCPTGIILRVIAGNGNDSLQFIAGLRVANGELVKL